MRSTARHFQVVLGAVPLLGCTSYADAVDCSAVYSIEAEHDSDFIHLQRYAEHDAFNKGKIVGKSRADVARDIRMARHQGRYDVVRQSPYRNDPRRRCDAFYE